MKVYAIATATSSAALGETDNDLLSKCYDRALADFGANYRKGTKYSFSVDPSEYKDHTWRGSLFVESSDNNAQPGATGHADKSIKGDEVTMTLYYRLSEGFKKRVGH